jgi:glycosyltransferase involved in cell wall biosynthesis
VPPAELIALADARSAARADRDWLRADELRAEIEDAGWKVVDEGLSFVLVSAAPPDIADGDLVRYGSAASVPSALADTATATATVVFVADFWPDDVGRALAGLRSHAPAGTQVVIVANLAAPEQDARLAAGMPDAADIAGQPVEVLHTSVRLGAAAALNVGLRRARGAVVIMTDASVESTSDAVSPVVAILGDPTIAVTGDIGTVSTDMRRFLPAAGPEVDAIDGTWIAFRRDDLATLGPLDDRFVAVAGLDTWWSLVLREGLDADAEPRRAVRTDLPLIRHGRRRQAGIGAKEFDRLARRNAYRVLDGLRGHPELLLARRGPGEQHTDRAT